MYSVLSYAPQSPVYLYICQIMANQELDQSKTGFHPQIYRPATGGERMKEEKEARETITETYKESAAVI